MDFGTSHNLKLRISLFQPPIYIQRSAFVFDWIAQNLTFNLYKWNYCGWNEPHISGYRKIFANRGRLCFGA